MMLARFCLDSYVGKYALRGKAYIGPNCFFIPPKEHSFIGGFIGKVGLEVPPIGSVNSPQLLSFYHQQLDTAHNLQLNSTD